MGPTFRTWERAFIHLVRCLLHAFDDIRSRAQLRAGRVVEVCVAGWPIDTARRVRAVDAGEGVRKAEAPRAAKRRRGHRGGRLANLVHVSCGTRPCEVGADFYGRSCNSLRVTGSRSRYPPCMRPLCDPLGLAMPGPCRL